MSTMLPPGVAPEIGRRAWADIRSTARAIMHRRSPATFFAVVALITGACSIVYEFIIGTSLTYLLGSSAEQWAATISIMVATMGFGAILQKYIHKGLTEIFIFVELLLVLVGGTSPYALQALYAYWPNSFDMYKVIYMAFIGLLVGIELPLMLRINEKHFLTELKDNVAGTFSLDYIGACIGGLLYVQMLKHFVPLTTMAFVTALGNLAVMFITIGYFWKRGIFTGVWRKLFFSAAAIAVTIGLFQSLNQAPMWSMALNQKLYEDPIVFQETTKYQNIVVTRTQHPFVPSEYAYDLWINGNRQFNSVDEAIYHENLVHPAMNLAARHDRVLILGGGDGMALREVEKYSDVKEITLVDLDAEMVKLFRDNPVLSQLNNHSFQDARVTTNLNYAEETYGVTSGPQVPVWMETDDTTQVKCATATKADGSSLPNCQEVPRSKPPLKQIATVNVFNVDADRFVSQPTGFWDVVIVDLPDPDSVELAKLYSREFYGKVHDLLSPDGVVVVQSTSPYHARQAYLCIMRTMTAGGLNILPYHANVPSFGDWGWLIGSPSLSSQELHDRVMALPSFHAGEEEVKTKEIGPEQLRAALTFNKDDLDTPDQSVSTLMDPRIFTIYHDHGWRVE